MEILVSLLILGVVLSAAAASLTGFSRQSVVNERRVQATAHLSQLHESLQALSWDLAVHYDTEVEDQLLPLANGALDGVDGLEVDPDDPSEATYNGQPLVVIEECPDGEPSCLREPFVPDPVDEDPDPIDGRSFERVVTLVTWDVGDPSDLDAGPAAKRFTTIVTWEVLGRTYEQRFESLRAPTAGDIAANEPPEIVTFDVSPATVPIDQDGTSELTVGVVAKFSRGLTQIPTVEFPCYEPTGTFDDDGYAEGNLQDPLCEVELDDTGLFVDGLPTQFSGEIELPSDRIWVRGEEQIRMVAPVLGGDPVTRTADLLFVGELELVAPTVSSVIVNPTDVRTVRGGARELCSTITVTATIADLAPEGSVSVSYPVDTGVGRAMEHQGGDTWTLVFEEGTPSPWQPSGGSTRTVTFTVTATNPGIDGDLGSAPRTSNTLSIQQRPNNSPNCPS